MANGNAEEPEYLSRFMEVYASLPFAERANPVLVLTISERDEPVSWNMAYRELKQNSELGNRIGKKLVELKII